MSNTNADDTAECYNTYAQDRGDSARVAQRTAVNLARFANMGVDTDAVKAAYTLGKKRDPHTWLKALTATAVIVDLIPTETDDNGQVSFMPGLTVPPVSAQTKQAVREGRAYSDGYNTGLRGGDETNNKYNAGTAERARWSTGHIDGQEQRAINLANKKQKPNVTEAPTERRGRGRPRKAAVETPPQTQLEKDEAAYREPAAVH